MKKDANVVHSVLRYVQAKSKAPALQSSLLHTTTDANGLSTILFYDAFNKQKATTLPDGNKTEEGVQWAFELDENSYNAVNVDVPTGNYKIKGEQLRELAKNLVLEYLQSQPEGSPTLPAAYLQICSNRWAYGYEAGAYAQR